MRRRKPNKLKILKHPHPGLDKISEEVDLEEWDTIHELLVLDMINTMEKAEGVGLAAPQVGVNERMFVMKTHNGEIHVWVNPSIDVLNPFNNNERIMSTEGCLSCPGAMVQIERLSKVVAVGWDDESFDMKTVYYDNIHDAITFQHELDHLSGITILNRQIKVPAIAVRSHDKL